MTSHCDSNPAQYERNRRFGHLVHALGRAAGGAKLPSRDYASPEADRATELRREKATRGSGTWPPAGRQLRELEKATRGSGTLPLRRPTAQRRARESNTRLGDFATAGRQLRQLEKATRAESNTRLAPKATRGSRTLPIEPRGTESNTRLAYFADRTARK
ncbi:hypothetical protein PUN28_020501 [Cardiocondyla obscurior]|uniref:Uncharacterized protein n=1 Tax=Cardiocondyla obscurior TaxID=286306 RepID=A0AAW2E6C1_9HYME